MEEFMNRQEAVRRATELVEQMSVEELASQLRFDADEIPHLDIPEYNWWNEGLHGVARAGTATVFPQAIGLGATFDEELLDRVGVAVFHADFGPGLGESPADERDHIPALARFGLQRRVFRVAGEEKQGR